MGNWRKWLGLTVTSMGLSLATGCLSPSPEAEERLAALEREAEEMDTALDSVEERLLGNQAALHTWAELSRRHQQVSELHCQAANAHVAGLMKHYQKMEEKGRQLKRRRGTVASVDAVLTSGKAKTLGKN